VTRLGGEVATASYCAGPAGLKALRRGADGQQRTSACRRLFV